MSHDRVQAQDSLDEASYECPNVLFQGWLLMHPEIWAERHTSGDFAEVRQRYYEAESLQQLFHEINVTYLFDFLCEIVL